MKTIDQLKGISEAVIGETEAVKPQFDVLVPQGFQIGGAADRTHTMIVLDPRSPGQVAFVLPRAGALEFARQLLDAEKEMVADEAKAKGPSKVLMPGLGAPLCLALALVAALHATPARAAAGAPQQVSAGQVVETCVVPKVTASNAYGTNYVVGGALSFPGAFPLSGGGAIQSVYVNVAEVETSGFTFVPLSALPQGTWTDAAVAAITTIDKGIIRGPISLTASSILGTHTALWGTTSGQVMNVGGTTGYGLLIANAALTNQFAGTAGAPDVQVCIDVVQFP